MNLRNKYNIKNKIYESSKSLIFLGENIEDNNKVIIKVLNSDYPDTEAVTRFKYEYELLKNLEIPGTLKIVEVLDYENSIALIRECFNGEPLTNIDFSRFDISYILEIFIKMAKCVSNIHQQNIIHKDINPSNILWNRKTGEVKIIDFEISTKLSNESLEIKSPNSLEGTISYISPEQTGRINRPVDYRTDLYSLGITFYKLITGELPFYSDDNMELIHMHIAKSPLTPHEINTDIPEQISKIIIKLMNKMAEDRYKSTIGLIADLELCLSEYKYYGKIKEFKLGKKDFSGKFQVSNKLYGRDNEIKQVLEAFKRVNMGSIEVLLISGYSGVGKTSLVNELNKPLTEKRGYLISGKYEELKKSTPYSAILEALNELISQILTESKESIEVWKTRILSALKNQSQVLIEVLPDLELIIGKQAEVQTLNATESSFRFNRLLSNFIKVFLSKKQPLVLFLDDLQWVDLASLKLLESFITNNDFEYLFIIGAYRDNEIDNTHILKNSLKNLENNLAPLSYLKLNELNNVHIAEIIQDNFPSDSEYMKKLANLCYKKTAGNPFFLKQFLSRLYTEQYLVYDYDENIWSYNLDNIEKTNITENVIDLMTKKIEKLSFDSQTLLKIASCIGSQFNLDILSKISNNSIEKLSNILWDLLAEELIFPLNDSYRFVKDLDNTTSIMYKFYHDKIRQAAYSMLPVEERKDIHINVARLLNNQLVKLEKDERIFELVNHYNEAADLVIEDEELQEVAKLNIQAGIRAKNSGAYQQALILFENAINFSNENYWHKHYNLAITLYSEAAEACFLTGNYTQMKVYTQLVFNNSKTPIDKIKAYESNIYACLAKNEYEQGLILAKDILKELGLTLPKKPDNLAILSALIKTKTKLKNNKIDSLLYLDEMKDEKMLATMKVLSNILSLCYVASPNLFPIVVLTQVQLSLKYGNTSSAAEAYALYGLILAGVLKDYDSAYKVGNVALKLSKEDRYNQFRERVIFYVSNFVLHWKEKVSDILNHIDLSYNLALQNGDLEYAAWAIFLKCEYNYYSGITLNEALEAFNECEKTISKLKQIKQLTYTHVFQNLISLLANKKSKTEYEVTSKQLLDNFDKINDGIGLYFINYSNAIYHYYTQNYSLAVKCINNAEKYLENNLGSMNYPMFYFKQSLILLKLYEETSDENLVKQIKKNQKLFKKWGQHSPKNYQNKYLLIEAELSKIKDNFENAIKLYTFSIELAKENGNLVDEAYANELAFSFYLKEGQQKIAVLHLKDAYFTYKKLGLLLKANNLQIKYPEFISSNDNSNVSVSTLMSSTQQINSTSSAMNMLDFTSILKASQALSGEIQLNKLLEQMMNYLIENAGAQKGCLLLAKNDELFVETEIDLTKGKKVFLQSQAYSQSKDKIVPSEIINYVLRTKQHIVIEDAINNNKFSNSVYIKEKSIKSILCVPMLNKQKLIGLLYLENNLTTSAFSEERIQMLDILASQLAISVENANIYSELEKINKTLEEKVKERTEELNIKNKKLTDSIDYAKRIQSLILPRKKDISSYFSDYFLIYLPVDVVSGDFYWSKILDDKCVFAVVDCTGHGVPGGFLSMIGSTLLDKIVTSDITLDPSLILRELHKEVRSILRQDEEKAKIKKLQQLDGMDVSICIFDKANSKLLFAGAKLPLYHLKWSNSNKELIRIRGDKKSIGGRQKEKTRLFSTHEIELGKNDIVYLASDGYTDQNDPLNNMLGINNLEKTLFELSNIPLTQQKKILLDKLDNHMNGEKQRDDITLVGIKI